MKPLKESIRNDLAKKFGLDPAELVFLAGGREDSDGIVFSVNKAGKKLVFKISQVPDEMRAKSIHNFANYLGGCGIHISRPLKNETGNIYESAKDGDTLFIAILTEYINGHNPDVNELQNNVKLVYDWGKLTGKSHKAAKAYPIWKNSCESDKRFGFEAEIDSLIRISPNNLIKDKWLDMRKRLGELPIDRDCYGFIHNDNHQMNIIASDKDIAVIDFDCAECHFFANDILLPIQGLLFDVSGGMMNPVSDMDVLKRFYANFLEGYLTENEIDGFWLKNLGLFLEYRRLLLYTVMQDWLSKDKGVDEAFLSMIENPCELSIYI